MAGKHSGRGRSVDGHRRSSERKSRKSAQRAAGCPHLGDREHHLPAPKKHTVALALFAFLACARAEPTGAPPPASATNVYVSPPTTTAPIVSTKPPQPVVLPFPGTQWAVARNNDGRTCSAAQKVWCAPNTQCIPPKAIAYPCPDGIPDSDLGI